MEKHNHGATSNTDEVFRTFIGDKIKGILHGSDFGHSNVILVFECGWGLCFSSNGSHWAETPDGIEHLKRETKEKIDHLLAENRDILNSRYPPQIEEPTKKEEK